MHVPDGFLDLATSLGTGVVAAGGVAMALRGARLELDERTGLVAGLTAVFVFAGQMINFPVAAGTSGHLLGGALAAVLVGPYLATPAITVVLIVQAFAFADGGLSALGTNVVLMALVGVWAGWLGFRLAQSVLPRRLTSVPVAAAVGGLISVPAAALAFCALFAIGGRAPVSVTAVTAAMLGVHALIGLGEAAITFFVISSVVASRPDLVRGARGLIRTAELEIREGVPA